MTEREPHSEPAPDLGLVEQRARVVAVAAGLAWVVPAQLLPPAGTSKSLWVETSRAGACGGCSSTSACAVPVLGSLAGSGAATAPILVTDHLGLRIGDRVVVGIPDGTLIQASALAYLLPPALLVLAASGAGALGLGDLGSALVGLIGLALGLALTWLLAGGAAARGSYRPVLVRRHQALPGVTFNFQQIERGIGS